VTAFLRTIAFPKRARAENFKAGPEAAARIERAKLLEQAGLSDWAEQELRFAARNGDQPYVMALELASLSSDKPDQALHSIKSYAGGYLFCRSRRRRASFGPSRFRSPSAASRESVETKWAGSVFNGRAHPAGVRVQSEGGLEDRRSGPRPDPAGTGRELSRRLKLTSYSVAALFQPHLNLELGTYY